MKNLSRSWTLYSVGLFVVWAIVLTLVWKLDGVARLKEIALIFAGYCLGWLSATIKHFMIIRRSR